MKRANKLANSHWEWILKMLKHTKETKGSIKTIGVYYKSAFIHGYKHGRKSK